MRIRAGGAGGKHSHGKRDHRNRKARCSVGSEQIARRCADTKRGDRVELRIGDKVPTVLCIVSMFHRKTGTLARSHCVAPRRTTLATDCVSNPGRSSCCSTDKGASSRRKLSILAVTKFGCENYKKPKPPRRDAGTFLDRVFQ